MASICITTSSYHIISRPFNAIRFPITPCCVILYFTALYSSVFYICMHLDIYVERERETSKLHYAMRYCHIVFYFALYGTIFYCTIAYLINLCYAISFQDMSTHHYIILCYLYGSALYYGSYRVLYHILL